MKIEENVALNKVFSYEKLKYQIENLESTSNDFNLKHWNNQVSKWKPVKKENVLKSYFIHSTE